MTIRKITKFLRNASLFDDDERQRYKWNTTSAAMI